MEKYKNIMAEMQKSPAIESALPDGEFFIGMKDDLEELLNNSFESHLYQ